MKNKLTETIFINSWSLIKHSMILIISLSLFISNYIVAQTIENVQKVKKEKYYIGTEKELMIRVHIWGGVNKPGEYTIPDGSTVLDLLSIAGGPTDDASLNNVIITHKENRLPHIIIVDIKAYLEKKNENEYKQPSVLFPGDIVRVKKNYWYKWKQVLLFSSQVASVVNMVYWVRWLSDQFK